MLQVYHNLSDRCGVPQLALKLNTVVLLCTQLFLQVPYDFSLLVLSVNELWFSMCGNYGGIVKVSTCMSCRDW